MSREEAQIEHFMPTREINRRSYHGKINWISRI